jgi:branched-chain amino acid transport system substrate-binding protein
MSYQDRYQVPPNYASFKMAQAILGVKAAYEKAKGTGSAAPDQDKIIAGLENLTFESPGGTVKMSLGKGHQAVMDAAVGTTKVEGGQLKIVDVVRYPADKVNPPDGVKSADWIKSGLKK